MTKRTFYPPDLHLDRVPASDVVADPRGDVVHLRVRRVHRRDARNPEPGRKLDRNHGNDSTEGHRLQLDGQHHAAAESSGIKWPLV